MTFVEWCRDVLGLTFTPYQDSVARVVGGEDPSTEIDRAVWGFTGPVESHARAIIGLRLGRRGFKTTLSAAFALWRAMTADLSEARGGAPIMCPIVAPSEPGTKIALGMAVHLATTSTTLHDCINVKSHEEGRKRMAITTSSLHLLRPQDGMAVEIRAVVASPAGKNLVGYHIPALILDEAERMRADSDAGVTDSEQLDAALPSVLPGGAALLISTPYDLDSYMHHHVERNWGHPVDGLAAVATTRQLRPDSPMVLDMVAREFARRPQLAMRDFECIPFGRPDAYYAVADVDACTIDSPPITRSYVSAAVDLAFIHDGCALVVVERQGDALVQTLEILVQPSANEPLRPSAIRDQFLSAMRASGASICAADVHEFSSLCETLLPAGVQVTHAPTDHARTTAFAVTRDLLRNGQLRVLRATAEQLKRVGTSPKGGPDLPHVPGEGHSDLVSALVAAVWLDRRHGAVGGPPPQRPASFPGAWTM